MTPLNVGLLQCLPDQRTFSRSENVTLCFLNIKSDLGIIGIGEHEDPKEAERLAYEDAQQKASVIPIKNLRMYQWWKQQKRQP